VLKIFGFIFGPVVQDGDEDEGEEERRGGGGGRKM